MYLLLRNNKQTGPLSLEELKSLGLKAYDLVWSEGKSAAWRYPCEIEELKAFAPQVDEQPFDRFYRRPAAAATSTPPTAPIPVAVESTKTPGKRIIYVTMPAARNTTIITSGTTNASRPEASASRAETSASRAEMQREPVRENSQSLREDLQSARETAYATPRENAQPLREPQSFVREERASAAEYTRPAQSRTIEDYAAPQIEDPAIVEEFFPRKKRSPRVMRLLIIGICILALLAAGIIIGLNLNKDTLGFPAKVVARIPPTNTDQTIVHPTAQNLPAPAATPPATTADSTNAVVEQPNATTPPVSNKTILKTITVGIKPSKEKPAHPITQANGLTRAKDSAAGGSAVANTIHRADIAEPHRDNTEIANKETVKAALASQVSVGANGYSVGTFGGITDLQLTVTNRSAYPLEMVIVEVQYIQANKKVFKTENLYFRSIGAGAALMQEAPKSSRGVKVQYKITSITSKEGLSYSGI